MKTYIVTTISFPGYWGRSNTSLQVAAAACKKAGASSTERVAISVVINDDDAGVDGLGMIVYGGEGKQDAQLVNVGRTTLGGILRAYKE